MKKNCTLSFAFLSFVALVEITSYSFFLTLFLLEHFNLYLFFPFILVFCSLVHTAWRSGKKNVSRGWTGGKFWKGETNLYYEVNSLRLSFSLHDLWTFGAKSTTKKWKKKKKKQSTRHRLSFGSLTLHRFKINNFAFIYFGLVVWYMSFRKTFLLFWSDILAG